MNDGSQHVLYISMTYQHSHCKTDLVDNSVTLLTGGVKSGQADTTRRGKNTNK